MPQTLLITGANRGVGLAMAQAALARGDCVIAVARAPEQAQDLAALARQTDRLAIHGADVTDEASLAALAQALESRAVDILVANAGVLSGRGGLDDLDYTRDSWAETMMVNVFGPFATARALLPAVKRGQGRKIAVIASIMGSTARASGGSFSYRASKAAAVNLACNLAAALRSEGVAVGAYHPGWVRTRMGGSSAAISAEDSAAGLLSRFDELDLDSSGVFADYAGGRLPY